MIKALKENWPLYVSLIVALCAALLWYEFKEAAKDEKLPVAAAKAVTRRRRSMWVFLPPVAYAVIEGV